MEISKQSLFHKFSWLFITVVVIWTCSNINWASHRAYRIIKVDGNGYYAYLPAVFIYHDLSFAFFEEIRDKYPSGNLSYEYRHIKEGSAVNKYFAGTALAQLPFFLLADAATTLTSFDRDGYSYLYLLSISLAALFYLFAALHFFDRFLKEEGINLFYRGLGLLILVFGTNVFYYGVYEQSMSHVYSLAFVTAFIYAARRYAKEQERRMILLAGFALGMITLIRPVNVLVLAALPFLLSVEGTIPWKKLTADFQFILMGLMIFLAIIGLQPVIYKLQTGNFFVYSYANEGFDFTDRHFWSFLASYRKGLWVYTPVTFISLAGFIPLWKNDRLRAISLALFIGLVVFILSSWRQWYYGGSFSSRVMVEYMPFFIFPVTLLVQWIKSRKYRSALAVLLILLMAYNVIQTYQYYAGIIHWSDMNGERYWEIFLRFRNP